MKQWITIFVCVCFATLPAHADERLKKAEAAYDTKKYSEAIGIYESLLQEGNRSAELYFNLGNAYYRSNELGKAIYNYERAHKLNPADEDISINLGIAQNKTIDKIDSHENFFIAAVKSSLLTSLSTSGWAWWSIFSLFLAAVALFLFFYFSATLAKRLLFAGTIMCLALFLLTYFFGYSALRSRNDNKFAIITAKEVNVLNEPTSSGKSKFILHEGTKIRVVETNSNWILIKLDNGNEGWLKSAELGII